MSNNILYLEDRKYAVVSEGGIIRALRYGEPWRDLTGDNLVAALVSKINDLQDELSKAQGSMSNVIAWRELNADGRPVTDWIDGDPGADAVPQLGESIQLAYRQS